jgi:heme exporter protein B
MTRLITLRHLFWLAFRREWLLVVHKPSQVLQPLFFLTLIMALFPLAISPDQKILATIAAGVIWIAVLLASYLSSDAFFAEDWQAGIIDQWRYSPYPLAWCVQIKVIAHWLFYGVSISLMAPLLALLLALPWSQVPILILTLFLGSGIISYSNALAAALTLRARSAVMLVLLIALPLQIPVVIFAMAAIQLQASGGLFLAPLAFLVSLCLVSAALMPLAIALALKIMMTV